MYFGLTIRVYSASEEAGYHLGEEDDEKNDCGGDPEQGDAQRASLLALIAPHVQLYEANDEEDCCHDEQPRTRRLQSDACSRQPHRTQKGERQAASQSR
jgi:hypothetical protein